MKVTNYQDKILSHALKSKKTIILPEQQDSRVRNAANEMKAMGFHIASLEEFHDKYNFYKDLIKSKKFAKNWTENMIDDYLNSPLVQGLLLLDYNDNYSLVAGATISTTEVIRSAIRIVGLKMNAKWVSSIFFMTKPHSNVAYTYSDCGVIPDPDVDQLVDIAFNASQFHEILSNQEPKVAFLSFSTMGSAEHYKVQRIQDAVKKFGYKYPSIKHEGEMQFDAAISKDIANKKIKNSILKGNANVFIFPDLGSANIAYKITQYLAKYDAWGPLLCGLAKPVHDLSRGCSIKDIINIAAISTISTS